MSRSTSEHRFTNSNNRRTRASATGCTGLHKASSEVCEKTDLLSTTTGESLMQLSLDSSKWTPPTQPAIDTQAADKIQRGHERTIWNIRVIYTGLRFARSAPLPYKFLNKRSAMSRRLISTHDRHRIWKPLRTTQ
ncbi:hypothetical protein QR680_007156 [Steinernema hermaphroditum]|uniref:Uncharacterized protein n=1 Tax=Steinernema hermaphroditum TaxID=289476 RepID=A0AA39LYC5_9BILA|nr:hypothetical protein QR680_007156 [Steinernema hermaphroditum]